MTTNHPANGPVSLDRLHQIREILSKAAAQSDGGNLGYAMADAVKVIDGVLKSMASEQVRREHAAWSQATFGDVGPVGPLKHLAKEALEAAAAPDDLSEWADLQFLLWDAQRRAGISDEQITLAMVEKLAVNKQREWPEPKDGEPRLHIKVAGNSPAASDGWVMVPVEPTMAMLDEFDSIIDNGAEDPKDAWTRPIAAALQQEVKTALEHGMQRYAGAMQKLSEGDK
ncbi:dATP/dGTP pyrophosphohydrolase domain-containing protein [Salmonella enterica]